MKCPWLWIIDHYWSINISYWRREPTRRECIRHVNDAFKSAIFNTVTWPKNDKRVCVVWASNGVENGNECHGWKSAAVHWMAMLKKQSQSSCRVFRAVQLYAFVLSHYNSQSLKVMSMKAVQIKSPGNLIVYVRNISTLWHDSDQTISFRCCNRLIHCGLSQAVSWR